MRKTAQISEIADSRSTGVATPGVPPAGGAGSTFIGKLIRRAWFRPHKAAVGDDANDAASPRGKGTDHASNAARSPIDAGITRGASLWFGGRR